MAKSSIAVLLCALALSSAAMDSALAQAGSTGGSIGKQGKSASGVDQSVQETRRRPADAEEKPKRSGCPNIVGRWSSWASGIFGKDDTVFNKDGSALHSAGIPGKWSCEKGQLQMDWGKGAEAFKLSADGKQIIHTGTGAVGFSR